MKIAFKPLITILVLLSITICSCYKTPADNTKDINDLKVQVSDLQRRADSLTNALSSSNNNFSALTKSVDSIRIEMAVITSQISTLINDLTSANANINLINTQITELNARYIDLSTRLNYMLSQLSASKAFKYGITFFYTGADSASIYANAYDTTKWHYITVTIDTTRQVKIYIDGLKQLDYYRYNVPYIYSSVYLGASFFTSYSNFYTGLMDELRISNKVRDQREIQDYYSLSVAGTAIGSGNTKNPKQTLDNNTIGLYHFDNISGSKILENSVPSSIQGNLFGNADFVPGLSGNAISFDGITGRATCNMSIQTSPLTVEFWFKSNTIDTRGGTFVCLYGLYTSNIDIFPL